MRVRLLNFLKRPAVVAAVAVLVLRGLTLASRFLLSLLLARMLSPAEMGEFGLLTAVLAFALLAIGLEFYSYTLREMVPASPLGRTRIVANQLALAAIVLVLVVLLVVAAVALGLYPLRLAPWFVLILITEYLSLEATRILIITSRPIRAYIGVFMRGGIWVYAIAVLMFAAPSSRSLETVLIWWAGGGMLSIVFAAVSLSDLPWRELKGYRPDWHAISVGLRTARPFMLTAVGALVISYVDRFVIDQFVGRGALGIYTFYSTIQIGLLSLGASISHQFLPKVITGYSDGPAAYRASLRSFLRTLGIVAVATTIVSGVVMGPMLTLLGLTAYAAEIGVFYVMLPGVLLRILADVPSYALYAARSDKPLLICNLSTALVATLLNVLLIPVLGLYGAAVTGCIASVVLLLSLSMLAVRAMREHRKAPVVQASVGGPTDPDALYP